MFAGEYPCDKDSRELAPDQASERKPTTRRRSRGRSLVLQQAGRRASLQRLLREDECIRGHPRRARSRHRSRHERADVPAFTPDEDDSVFHYVDTATSRAGIGLANEKLALGRSGRSSRSVSMVAFASSAGEVRDLPEVPSARAALSRNEMDHCPSPAPDCWRRSKMMEWTNDTTGRPNPYSIHIVSSRPKRAALRAVLNARVIQTATAPTKTTILATSTTAAETTSHTILPMNIVSPPTSA
jgi:hypothetical protein